MRSSSANPCVWSSQSGLWVLVSVFSLSFYIQQRRKSLARDSSNVVVDLEVVQYRDPPKSPLGVGLKAILEDLSTLLVGKKPE